jgi:hypothetical protein
MDGDERTRFCHQCQKHVYDLTSIAPEQILQLIAASGGKFCGRLYRRADGRFLTSDCPVGAARIRRRLIRFVGRAAAIVILVCSGYSYALARYALDARGNALQDQPLVNALNRWTRGPYVTLGSILLPPD